MSGLVGRTALRRRITEITPESTPALEAIAHVICAMGGHIPNRDPESTGSCSYHRKVAAVAMEQADGATPSDHFTREYLDRWTDGGRREPELKP